MEFQARQSDLLRELSLAQGVVEVRATIPILSNLLLKATKGSIEVVATDLQVGLRTPCPARVSRDGSCTVSAKRLFEIIRALPDTDVEFSTPEPGQIQVSCRDSRFRLQTLPPEDYPNVAVGEPKGGVELPRDVFQEMVQRVLFAVTRDDNRFALNGALLLLEPEAMAMVATDGHRLAVIRKRIALKGVRELQRVLVPKKALAELVRFGRPPEEEEEVAKEKEGKEGKAKKKGGEKPAPGAAVHFSQDQNHLFFRVDERLLVSRMLEGNFPNYERVIPEGNNHVFSVRRDILTEAVRRGGLLSYEKTGAIRLQLSKGKLTISSSTPQVGEAEEPVHVDYDGPAMEIAFNGIYLLDWLGEVGCPEVEVALRDSETQGLFLPKGAYPFDYQYIIMPMRL